MTQYAKPAVRGAWGETATGGDLTDPGNTYASAGWQIGVKPPRQYFNWVLNYTFNAVRYFCQQGVAQWDPQEAYPIYGMARSGGGTLYISKQNGNTNQPLGVNAWWDVPYVDQAPNGDNSFRIASTAFVHSNYLPLGTTFLAIGGAIQNGQVPVGAVTQWQGSLSIAGAQISSPVAQSNTLLINGGYRSIQWTGQSGQPTWLIGSSDGVNFQVWNPSNFHVTNSDKLAGLVPTAAAAGNTIAQRDANGYMAAQYFEQASPDSENSVINQVITTQGSDGFLRKNSLAQLKAAMGTFTLADFASGINYFKLPNGKIVQWGQAAISGTTFVGFPIAFPNGCQSFTMTPIGNSNQFFLNGAPGPTGATVTNGTAVVCWTALGN